MKYDRGRVPNLNDRMNKSELKQRVDSETAQLERNVKEFSKLLRDKKTTKNQKIIALNKMRTNLVILTGYIDD